MISVRDISMLLEALLRTIKSLVLKDIMNKNGEVTASPTILCIIHNTHELFFGNIVNCDHTSLYMTISRVMLKHDNGVQITNP